VPADVTLISPFPPVVSGGPLTSGVASYTQRLSGALSRAGLRVSVVADQVGGEPVTTEVGGVTVHRHYRRGLRALPAAVSVARQQGAPVVHLQHEMFLYGGPSSVAGLAPSLAHLRRSRNGPVVTMHQVVDPESVDARFVDLHRVRVPERVARVAIRGVQGAVDKWAGMTVVHGSAFQRVIPAARVVHHGVEPAVALSRSASRRRLGLAQSEFVVLCFGFVAPYKGLEAALEAGAMAGPRVRIVIAGGVHPRLAGRDHYGSDLRRRFGSMAHFTGYVPDEEVAPLFSAADLVLLPYPRAFSSSGALTTALSYGNALLCSESVARCNELPNETITGVEPHQLAQRLLGLASDPRLLEQLRRSVDDTARSRSWDDVARRHVELYEEVIGADGALSGGLRPGESR